MPLVLFLLLFVILLFFMIGLLFCSLALVFVLFLECIIALVCAFSLVSSVYHAFCFCPRFSLLPPSAQSSMLALHCPSDQSPDHQGQTVQPDYEGQTVQRIFAIIEANGIEAPGEEEEVDMYPLFSRINHSCRPNCVPRQSQAKQQEREEEQEEEEGRQEKEEERQEEEEGRQVSMVTTREIMAGEELTWSYTPALASREERRRELAFLCWCQACGLEGEELGRPYSNDRAYPFLYRCKIVSSPFQS